MLIPIAIILVAIAVLIFFWAVKSNQFDDLERQGYSILFDDDVQQNPPETASVSQQNAKNDNPPSA